jgi:glycosyltransferase involved in cell wall biosynthesis
VHFVARALAQQGVPWVGDFRDQWSEYLLARWDPLSRGLIDVITAWTLRPAAAIMANTDGVADSISRASRRRVSCVRNGFDPTPNAGRPPLARTLGYFGRIDPLMQRPERLWPALRHALAQGRPWSAQFYLTRGGSGGLDTLRLPADLRSVVQMRTPLPHPEAQQRMQEMTALLILGWEAHCGKAAVGGKLYEYIGAARPVLVCAPSTYEARKLVEDSGTGVGAWSDEELMAALLRLERWTLRREGRLRFGREAQARLALDVFEDVRLTRPRSRPAT